MSTFRFLQFNMQFGQVWDESNPDEAPVNLDVTIEEIRRQSADIIMLQEVEHAQPGGEQIDPPPNFTRLRADLNEYFAYFAYPKPDPRELPFGIGLAILSRTPLRDKMRLDLPSPPIQFPFRGQMTTPTDRLLIGARTTVHGREVQLFNTHLLAFFMLGSGSTRHPFQRNLVAEQIESSPHPTLLSGDFNITNHEGLIAQFADSGYSTVQQTEVTWRRRAYVLDHIFYNSPLRPVAHTVVPTPASDHHMLVADFEFAD